MFRLNVTLFTRVGINILMACLALAIDSVSIVKILLDLTTANLRCPWKINDFHAFFFKEVKLAFPVIAHHKGIDVVLVHIRSLLAPGFFRNDKIHLPNCLYQSFSLLIGEIALFMLFIPVELIRGNNHNQIVSESFSPTQKVDVAVVEQVKCPVSNNSFHNMFTFISSNSSEFKCVYNSKPFLILST